MNHLPTKLAAVIGLLLCACATASHQSILDRGRCTDEIIDVVQRFDQSAIDTMVTITIDGLPVDTGIRRQDLKRCSSAFSMLADDSTITHVYVQSKSLPCISRLRWVQRIALSPTPLPLPVDRGQ